MAEMKSIFEEARSKERALGCWGSLGCSWVVMSDVKGC